MEDCERCGGARHVFDPTRNSYVACSCLRSERALRRYRRAGFPVRFSTETWKTFVRDYEVEEGRTLLGAARSLSRGEQPDDWVLLCGKPSRARQLAWALLLRSACDGGLEVRVLDVPSLIDAEFDKGRGAEVRETPVLIVQVGGDPTNRWSRVVLEKAFEERWNHRRFTVLVSEIHPSRIGTHYRSSKVDDAVRRRFVRVRVSSRESS